ncbi:MAG: hypothetical protein WCJ64_07375 [Rhodospirillaceae bacterium]
MRSRVSGSTVSLMSCQAKLGGGGIAAMIGMYALNGEKVGGGGHSDVFRSRTPGTLPSSVNSTPADSKAARSFCRVLVWDFPPQHSKLITV